MANLGNPSHIKHKTKQTNQKNNPTLQKTKQVLTRIFLRGMTGCLLTQRQRDTGALPGLAAPSLSTESLQLSVREASRHAHDCRQVISETKWAQMKDLWLWGLRSEKLNKSVRKGSLWLQNKLLSCFSTDSFLFYISHKGEKKCFFFF